ncbi:UDP-N-acetylmuramoyl-tripeptide--D-alanyl-D-alanine ligase [Cohnella caldifontis]|uniref:UDP-N-acetylmuramoyl-tripeptide--D-alanyl-D- alanine ligase n=1 Tax=Cohnella caldifontis TaxID=3027471 RepID=UPI0023EE06A7|nr:UDP-N-acetylmuramoyl-tripeptide--D-alanyl-D-alanine ligase [Cohnella sp. YIM B05605]
MIQATLREIAAWCGAEYDESAGAARIAGVSTDTRTLRPGELFVPLAGDRFDGHDYLETARTAGAAAALWARSRPVPESPGLPLLRVDDTLESLQRLAEGYLASLNAKVAAVTGSNGKTTTKDLLSSVLSTRFRVHKTEGNFNNHIGLPLTILRAAPDTEAFVLEMGMSARGEISLLSRLAKPDIAVITNIGEAHLEHLGSRRNIAKAKLEIADGLKPGGALIVNGDEPLLHEEIAELGLDGRAKVLTFGEGPDNALTGSDFRVTLEGTAFRVRSDGGEVAFEIPAPGKHNAMNALAAVAAGRVFGLSDAEIAEGLRSAKLTGMRIERTRAANGAVVLNDAYNASPTSVRAALALLAGLNGYRRKRIVLGDMLELGPEEVSFHAGIGKSITPEIADDVYLFGPLSIHTAEAAKPAFPVGAVRHFADKKELAAVLARDTEPDDLVLVKASRGMRLEEIVAALQKGDAL